MVTLAWQDGRVVDGARARVGVLDHGLLIGDGVFEALSVQDGVPFALTRHLERLACSARGLALPVPQEHEVRDAVAELVGAWDAAGAPRGAGLRILWTSGDGPPGSVRGGGPCRLVLLMAPAREHGEASVHVVPWTKNPEGALAGIKSLSYAENALALARARAQGATEAVFANTRGELCDGTTANVFIEDERGLATPPLTSGALAGVTRALVLEWAHEAGIPAREETLPVAAIHTQAHVALTASSRGIAPVLAVDGEAKRPGPLTIAMGEEFARRRRQHADP